MKANRELRKQEQAALDGFAAAHAHMLAAFDGYREVVDRRFEVVGTSDDSQLQPVVPLASTPAELVAHLQRTADPSAAEEPSARPKPAPPDAVVPIRRGDAGRLVVRAGGAA